MRRSFGVPHPIASGAARINQCSTAVIDLRKSVETFGGRLPCQWATKEVPLAVMTKAAPMRREGVLLAVKAAKDAKTCAAFLVKKGYGLRGRF